MTPQMERSDSRGCVPLLVVSFVAPILLFLVFTSRTTELSPPRRGDTVVALTIAVGTWIFCLIAGLRPKPRTFKAVVSATVWSTFAAFTCLAVSGIALDRIHEQIDFAGQPVTQGEGYLPIDSAQIDRGRGGLMYEVELQHYFALLRVDERDYLAAFGNRQRVWPNGYCVRVIVQTTGKASRIMAGPGPLPAGSVARCPR